MPDDIISSTAVRGMKTKREGYSTSGGRVAPRSPNSRGNEVRARALYLWRKRFATEGSAPVRARTLVPATILSTNTEVVLRLPNGVAIDVGNASPAWIAAVVRELTRSSS